MPDPLGAALFCLEPTQFGRSRAPGPRTSGTGATQKRGGSTTLIRQIRIHNNVPATDMKTYLQFAELIVDDPLHLVFLRLLLLDLRVTLSV